MYTVVDVVTCDSEKSLNFGFFFQILLGHLTDAQLGSEKFQAHLVCAVETTTMLELTKMIRAKFNPSRHESYDGEVLWLYIRNVNFHAAEKNARLKVKQSKKKDFRRKLMTFYSNQEKNLGTLGNLASVASKVRQNETPEMKWALVKTLTQGWPYDQPPNGVRWSPAWVPSTLRVEYLYQKISGST